MKNVIVGILSSVLIHSVALAGGGGVTGPGIPSAPKPGLRCESESKDIRFVIMEDRIVMGTSGEGGTIRSSNDQIDMVYGKFFFAHGSVFRFHSIVVYSPTTTVQFDTDRSGLITLAYSDYAQQHGTPAGVTMPFHCDENISMWH
jgi:hypothetical protein